MHPTDNEKSARGTLLKPTIARDLYPLPPWARALEAILIKLQPSAAVTTAPRSAEEAAEIRHEIVVLDD